MHDNCDLNTLPLKYERSIKDENFNVYYSFKERFDRRKSQNFKFDYVVKKLKQKELLKKINEVKIGNKSLKQKELTSNLERFYNSIKEVLDFFKRLFWNGF